MSEDRSLIYKIRWEIFIMAASLALSALVVLAIPSDFGKQLIEQQQEQKRQLEELREKQLSELTQSESGSSIEP